MTRRARGPCQLPGCTVPAAHRCYECDAHACDHCYRLDLCCTYNQQLIDKAHDDVATSVTPPRRRRRSLFRA